LFTEQHAERPYSERERLQGSTQQTHSHFVKLLVDVLVVLVVLAELGDQSAVRQREELRVLDRGKRHSAQAQGKTDRALLRPCPALLPLPGEGNRNLLPQRDSLLQKERSQSIFW